RNLRDGLSPTADRKRRWIHRRVNLSSLPQLSRTDVDQETGRDHGGRNDADKHDERIEEINSGLVLGVAFHLRSSCKTCRERGLRSRLRLRARESRSTSGTCRFRGCGPAVWIPDRWSWCV